MAGYTRQSLAAIQDGEDIIAAPLNAEFNQLQDAFNAVTGHTHDGTIGNSAKINLTGAAAVTGILPDANLPTTMGGKTFTSTVTISSGSLTMTANNASMELGNTAGANTPFIDFHSSGNANDFDSRIVASGGAAGSGNGTIDYIASGGHVFTGNIVAANIRQSVDTSVLQIIGGSTGGANIELYGSTHATIPNQMKIDANTTEFRNANGSGTPSVLIGGNTVWHAGNDGAGTNLDSDLLDGQHGSFYQNASNLNAGTLSDARLPGSMSGKNFTSEILIHAQTAATAYEYMRMAPTDYGVGKPGLFFNRNAQTNYALSVYDGVTTSGFTLNLVAQNVQANGVNVMTTAGGTFTGAVLAGPLVSTNGEVIVRSDGNRHLWFRTSGDLTRGLVYHDHSGGFVGINTYNTSGVFVRSATFREDGFMVWGGSVLAFGNAVGNVELRMNAATNSDWRFIANSSNEMYMQFSNNGWAGTTSYFRMDNGNTTFFGQVVGSMFLPSGSLGFGSNNGLLAGNADDATTSNHNLRIGTWFGLGIFDTSSNTCRTVFNARTGDITTRGNLYVGTAGSEAVYQTDGNIQFRAGMQTLVGNDLAGALVARSQYYTGSGANDTNLTIGHTIIVFKTATGPIRNATIAPCLSAVDSIYYRTVGDANAGTALSGTWRVGGDINAGSDFFTLARRVA